MPPPRWHSIFLHREDDSSSSSNDEPLLSPADLLNQQFIQANKSHDAQQARDRFRRPSQIPSLLRQREIAPNFAHSQLTSVLSQDLQRWRSWTGASKDILSVGWGPAGLCVIGAGTDHLNSRDVPYNKANNLLLGRVHSYGSSIQQLPGHQTSRDGLYMTVSHVTFAQHCPQFFSASYDRTVRVWDVSTTTSVPQARCRLILPHEKHVDIVEQKPLASPDDTSLLATAQQDLSAPISLWNASSIQDGVDDIIAGDRLEMHLRSERASRFNVFPSAMQWGTRNLLLAGFAENNQNDVADREGHICLWDVGEKPTSIKLTSCDESVFDVAWVPGRNIFYAATTPRNSVTLTHRKKTRTVVRVWSPFESPSRIREFECPALDINEIGFHPVSDNFVLASATDGRVYVWDTRKEDTPLIVLQHGSPIETLDCSRTREEADVGVRFMSWDRDGRNLYTGSSDGRIGCWNIMISPEDALVKEVSRFDSGVMAGSFSPDGTKLLIGTVKGSVEILSVGAAQEDEKDACIGATERPGGFDTVPSMQEGDDQSLNTQEGIETARELVRSGQIEIHDVYGAGRGENYAGPWEKNARAPGVHLEQTSLLPEIGAQQFSSSIRRQGQNRGGRTLEISDNLRRVARAVIKERRVESGRRRQQQQQKRQQPVDAGELIDEGSVEPASSRSFDIHSSPCASSEESTILPALLTEDEMAVGLQAPSAAKRKLDEAIGQQRPRKKSRDVTPVMKASSDEPLQSGADVIDVDTYSFSPSWRSDLPSHMAKTLGNNHSTNVDAKLASPTRSTNSLAGEKWRAILDGSPSKSPIKRRSPEKRRSEIATEPPSTPSRTRTLDSIWTPSSSGRNGFIVPPREKVSRLPDEFRQAEEKADKDKYQRP